MRLVLISDTHLTRPQLPDGDVLVHAGDLTIGGSLPELKDATDWLNKQPHKHKVAIAGNHDFVCQGFYAEGREDILQADFFRDVKYLRDSETMIEGVKFYGSPWTPEFFDWAFNLPRGLALKEVWDKIPTDTDVLITHGPPAYYRDSVKPSKKYKRAHAGCDDLLDAIERIQPRLHIFGHIHSGHGIMQNGNTTLVNAAVTNNANQLVSEPIVLDIKETEWKTN